MKSTLLVSILFIFSVGQAAIYNSKGGEMTFLATGKPGFLKIKGDSAGKYPEGKLTIEDGKAQGEFLLDLTSLDTHIDLRNEHMKDKYLEVKKYPKAKLVLKPITLKDAELKTDFKADFTGDLTIRDVTKEIKGSFDFKAKDTSATTKFNIKISDFNIAIPSHLGVTVSETVDVTTVVKLQKEEAKK